MVTTRMHPVPWHGPADGARVASPGYGVRGQQQWERANRRGLLAVHSLIGILAGALILLDATAGTFDGHGGSVRLLTGSLALGGGGLLLGGLVLNRTMRLEIGGLLVLAVWSLTMAAGFVAAAVAVGDLTVASPWHLATHTSHVRLYPIVVYVGLFVMMCVHLTTLRQVHRVERRGRMTVARPV